MHKKYCFALLILFQLFLQQGCSPIINHYGTKWKIEKLKHITQQDALIAELGQPSFTSTFREHRWYYVTSTTERFAFLKPKVTDFSMLEVRFDQRRNVKSLIKHSKESCRSFPYFSKTTPTTGHSTHFFEQVFGNFGRLYKQAPGKGF